MPERPETPSSGALEAPRLGRGAWTTIVAVVVLVAGALVANVVQRAHSSDSQEPPEPAVPGVVTNAVLFLVDDMSDFSCAETRAYLPRSSEWLLDQGTCFENATSSTPVCCPARAQIQTGQFSHNNRVVSQVAARNLEVRDTLQHDLGQIGIDTYGIGKNLNGITADQYFGPEAIDNGFADFDFWNSYRGPAGTFKLYDDQGRRYTPTTGLSTTETNGAFLDTFLDAQLPTGRPFFVYDAFVAPHKQDVGFDAASLPPPSVAHADDPVPPFRWAPEGFDRDKLPIFQGQRFSRAYYERLWTAKVRALYDVDDQMADTFERLDEAGVLDQTAIIFTSDNGYTDRGQVNWEGKSIPYPAATDVPMLGWFPGREPAVDDRPVALIDVPATFYDVLDVVPGHQLDGHSLLSDHRREFTYGEFYNENSGLSRRESGPLASNLRSWRSVRQGDRAYVEWYGNGGDIVFTEFYDDPGMTKNLLAPVHRAQAPDPALVESFRQTLQRLGTCQGTAQQGSPQPCA
ncbi:sulfatase-like hydrolase/transferase [Nocardioides sp. C4-1]|uniref:sulfatase-like hydrolase/transferase n=1 Tax=Nocardioides sp. C4-1 TaxID=3151851 RepID=UPI0032649BF0